MSGPPPPPPPHGHSPRSGGLPPGKYDIFVIPEHSAGSGFLYLPSLRPSPNSFAAGFASALILVAPFQSMAPAFRVWWDSFQGLGNMGITLLIVGVGFGAWALGRAQKDPTAGRGPHSRSGNGGQPSPGFGGSSPNPSSPGSPPPPRHGANTAPPPHTPPPPPPPPPPGAQDRGSSPPPRQSQPKSSWQRPSAQPNPSKPETPKGAWEKAREETRRKEERRAKEAEQKRRDEAARLLAELRAREARERQERDRKEQEARDKKAAEAAAEGQKKKLANEQRRKQVAERIEKQRQERLAREKQEQEKKNAAAAAAAAAAADASTSSPPETAASSSTPKASPTPRGGSSYAYSSVGEKTNMWPNGRPNVPSAAGVRESGSPEKRPPAPTARTYVSNDDDGYSYRPYDSMHRGRRRPSASSIRGSEYSSAPSQTTARTSPPPSVRGGYSTKDPDKIVIRAVYLFMNQYAKTPASQLISGLGSVTDGLILRITTEGLFIDDNVRGVPQREWDVKAWTLKQVEAWCPPHCLETANAAATAAASGAKSPPAMLFKMAQARRNADKDKVLMGEDADVYLTEMLRSCRECCRFGMCGAKFKDTAVRSPSGKGGEWRDKGVHILRATARDQEGKRYLFLLDETEGWKVAVGLQRLRRGTQVRQLGVGSMSPSDARGTLETLGWIN